MLFWEYSLEWSDCFGPFLTFWKVTHTKEIKKKVNNCWKVNTFPIFPVLFYISFKKKKTMIFKNKF